MFASAAAPGLKAERVGAPPRGHQAPDGPDASPARPGPTRSSWGKSSHLPEVQAGRGPNATRGDLQSRSLQISVLLCNLGLSSPPRRERPAPPPRARPAPYRPRAGLPPGLFGDTRGPGRGANSAPSVPGGKARPEKAGGGGGCRKSEPPLRGRPLKGRPSAAMAGETRRQRPRPRPPASLGPAAAATAIVERCPPLSPLLTSRHAF